MRGRETNNHSIHDISEHPETTQGPIQLSPQQHNENHKNCVAENHPMLVLRGSGGGSKRNLVKIN